MLVLHQEMIEFWQAFRPTRAEAAARADLVKRVSALVTNEWPEAFLRPFGSYETGLYLPESDVDLMVVGSGLLTKPERVKGLRRLEKRLRRCAWGAEHIEVIDRARVPIIKFVDSQSRVAVDISMETKDGIISSALSRKVRPPFLSLCVSLASMAFRAAWPRGRAVACRRAGVYEWK